MRTRYLHQNFEKYNRMSKCKWKVILKWIAKWYDVT